MAMQLYSFVEGKVVAHFTVVVRLADTGHVCNGNFLVVAVKRRNTFDFDKIFLFDKFPHFRKLFVADKDFYRNGIRKIRDVKHHNCPLIADFPLLDLPDHAGNNNFSKRCVNLFYRHRFFIKIPAV